MKKTIIISLIFVPVYFFGDINKLVVSAKNGSLSQVQYWINKGIAVNSQDTNGRTALMEASRFGHIKIIKFLVERNADVNLSDRYGFTALMFAVHNGHIDITEFLLNNRANIKAKDSKGRDALHYAHAAVKNSKKLIQIIKKRINQ